MNQIFARPTPARRVLAISGAALAATLLLSGCSSAPAASDPKASAETATDATAAFELADGWAKAGDGMTGVFGSLTNSGDEDLTLVSVASPAAGMIELHETVTTGANATMREKEGGFVIPAGGSYELEPGGDHIMFMDLAQPLLAGDEVKLTLTFADGSTVKTSVLVKDYEGAQENYEDVEGMDHGDMEGMDHGDTDQSDTDAGASHAEHAG
ncbi:copper chaperone PCu(A)C [Leucobacter chromiireducens]|uniref:Copper chaperone PCu(A)C n=1 Tax=Leucobacter chromiireducens subsp. solipictus TaxID=398235 RepID=A0ABS1SC63_9MICO|nr:copper chaperone PCu(A)C [Leucobacter chromiireducens]MBL3678129.1 copper chaperone PCu(A)C [Leucobacter chromiireducens subsp. solipictus]